MITLAYRAPPWLPGGNLQTLYPALLAPRPQIVWRRERWDTPDGDFIDLDWTTTPVAADAPLFILFHGLEGSSRSHYARALMHAAAQRSWQGVVVHFRGCGGELNRLPRAYHSGDSDEIDWILRRIAPTAERLVATGISLGGNALLKWLGERGDAAQAVLARAAAVSAPLDLQASGDALDRGLNRVLYTRMFLKSMKASACTKLAAHRLNIDAARMLAARTLRAFDDAYTAPLHGFRDVDDYWTRASSAPWLAHIRVPTLVLNAKNDPFLPRATLAAATREASASVLLESPETGGHVGFLEGPFPGRHGWLPRRLLEFLSEDA